MTSSAWIVARYQRYSSGVVSRPLAVPIAAAVTWRGSCPHPIWSGRVLGLPTLLAVAGMSVAMRRPVLPGIPADDTREDT